MTKNKSEVVFNGILSVLDQHPDTSWIGTMTNLSSLLNRALPKTERSMLPRSPSALRIVVNQVVNRLRNRGIGVKFARTTDHGRTRYVRFSL